MRYDLTQERLKQILRYDEVTGHFFWKERLSKNIYPGDLAGTIYSNGYMGISIDKVRYPAHRLAWFYVHGVWPKEWIDHISGNKYDNSIENLREATYSENHQNRKTADIRSNLGILGVQKSRDKIKFIARICTNGVRKHLGTFDTAEQASAAYIEAKRKLHSHGTL